MRMVNAQRFFIQIKLVILFAHYNFNFIIIPSHNGRIGERRRDRAWYISFFARHPKPRINYRIKWDKIWIISDNDSRGQKEWKIKNALARRNVLVQVLVLVLVVVVVVIIGIGVNDINDVDKVIRWHLNDCQQCWVFRVQQRATTKTTTTNVTEITRHFIILYLSTSTLFDSALRSHCKFSMTKGKMPAVLFYDFR